jgi:hypothetical protein
MVELDFDGRLKIVLISVALAACSADDGGNADDAGTGPGDTTAMTAAGTDPGPGGDTTVGDGAEATTTGADTGTGTTAADTAGGVISTCGLPTTCGQRVWPCAANHPGSCADVPYDDALVCALQQMAAGAQLQHYIEFNGYLTGEVDWLDIAVYDATSAVSQYGIEDSLSYEHTFDPPQRCTPKPAAWFEACLADEGDEAEHAACMDERAWFDDCVETDMCL